MRKYWRWIMKCLNNYSCYVIFGLKFLPTYSRHLKNMVYRNRINCEITIRGIRKGVIDSY